MKAFIIYLIVVMAFISVFIIMPIESRFTVINEAMEVIQTIK